QLQVLHRAFLAAPAALFPAVEPVLVYGALYILRVRVQRDGALLLQRAQRGDDGGQLHAVVGRARLAAGHLLLVPVIRQHRRPAAGAASPGAGPVGVDGHGLHSLSSVASAEFSTFSADPVDSSSSASVSAAEMTFAPSFGRMMRTPWVARPSTEMPDTPVRM